MKKPKVIWAGYINMSGLFCIKPLKCKWDEDCEEWFAEEADLIVYKIGLDVDSAGSYITFSSKKEEDVRLWIQGARAAITMIGTWAHSGFQNMEAMK